jgi:hypothetical protein
VAENESAPDSIESRTLSRTALPRSLLDFRLVCLLVLRKWLRRASGGTEGLSERSWDGLIEWLLRVAVVGVVIIVIFFFFAVVLLFVLFLVGLLAKEGMRRQPIRRV